MTELKDVEGEIGRFRGRLYAAAGFVLLAFSLLVARLVDLQVFRHDELATQAENNRIAVVPIVPNRGEIVDRHGVVMATNYSAYTLEIAASRLREPAQLDALIDQLATVVTIEPRDRRRFKQLQEELKGADSLPIRTRLTDAEVARFLAQRYRFPGVDVKARLFRDYPLGATASHVLGYIGRINEAEKTAMEDWDEADQANYRGTESIGKLGVEQSYERLLHGTTGFEEVETSAGGRAVRRLGSQPPIPGATLQLSIDARLQALVERLYGKRRGALVAMDPRNGEVLAFVSMPTFDPNLFVDGIDSENWRALNDSPDKPLLNRALRGTYPPGSTYKPYMALAALATGVRTPQQTIVDPGYFMFGSHKFRDDKEGGHGVVDMYRSLVVSCDTYYYRVAADLGVDAIAEHMRPFGFGEPTGIDIQGEARGVLPSEAWKRRVYRKPEQQRWYAGETISLGIGQGYNNYTVLQMAQALSTLAEGGRHFVPHLVHEIVDPETGQRRLIAPKPLPTVPIDPAALAVVRQAMIGVNADPQGTVGEVGVFKGAPYVSAGKTGTAQVVGIKQNEKYNAKALGDRLTDHALYVVYAPADAPRIVVALVVENAGFGASAAAPIARRVLDYELLGQYPSEEDIAATALGKTTAPIGTPRRAADVPLPGEALGPVATAAPASSAPSAAAPVTPGAAPAAAASAPAALALR
ncbi:MAG: penicillin-binding protein 2 [Burkholderiales bacterium]|nr:penicillin-binding protein 2 [Burkholderiales bacterium]